MMDCIRSKAYLEVGPLVVQTLEVVPELAGNLAAAQAVARGVVVPDCVIMT